MNCETFLRDVKKHQIRILRDDGLYRHIRFKRTDTNAYYFDLITWPGALCYTGDMGTFVFSRLADMFEFFRTDRDHIGELRINPGYWSEKLLAVDGGRRSGSATEFDPQKFERVIKECLAGWLRHGGLNREERSELRALVQDDILDMIDEDERGNYDRAYSFCEDIGGREFRFEDLWDYSFTKYTNTFLWCCYALSWGIQKYDEHKAPPQPADENQIDMAEVWGAGQ